MSDASEESPAQRQARIRREKREAKIKAGGTERLDKITRLSGRTPDSMRDEHPSPSPSPAPAARQPQAAQPQMPPLSNAADPAQLQAQQEYLRSLLRAQDPQPGQGQAPPEDPMMKMLNSMMGGGGPEGPDAGTPQGLPFSPEDVSKATGLPQFLTDMIFGQQKAPPTAAQEKSARIWSAISALFSGIVGMYVVYLINVTTRMFGPNPPPPAVIQNPFLIFMTGEVLIRGTQMLLDSPSGGGGSGGGVGAWLRLLKGMARDGCIVVFMMGAASWWQGAG